MADDDFLVFAAGGVEAVFVENHLAGFGPLPPGFLRDVIVDFLTQFGVKGRLVEARELLFQLYAKNFVRHCHFLARRSTQNYLTMGEGCWRMVSQTSGSGKGPTTKD